MEINGYVLPDIPSDAFDKYPYGIIMQADTSFLLVAVPSELLYVSMDLSGLSWDAIGCLDAGNITYQYNVGESTEWVSYGEDTTAFSMMVGLVYGMEINVVWSNHNILVAALNADGSYTATSDVYYSCDTLPARSVVKENWLKGVAKQVRRLTETEDKLTTDAMLTGLKNLDLSTKFNIAYGETQPTDTNLLWIKSEKPKNLVIQPEIDFDLGVGDFRYDVSLSSAKSHMGSAMVGTKIYFFGGKEETGSSNVIEIFDAETNTMTISSIPLPEKTYGIGAASVGTKIYLFGGYGSSSKYLNTIYAFDTETETLTLLDTVLPTAARYIGVASIGTKIYLFGGDSGETYDLSGIYSFDTGTETLTLVDGIPSPNYQATIGNSNMGVAVVGTKIWLFGGIWATNGSNYSFYFDTETETASSLFQAGGTSHGIGDGTAAVAIGTKVYLFGGHGSGMYNKTVYIYDTEQRTSTKLSVVYPTEYLESMAAFAVGTKIYLFGGYNYKDSYTTSSICVFDTETEIMTGSKTFLYGIGEIASATVGTKIYLFGGDSDDGYQDTIYAFDTETEVLTVLDTTIPVELSNMTAAAVGTKIYLFGGITYDSGIVLSSAIYMFDTETQAITTLDATLPVGTRGVASAVVGTKIYLFGGETYVLGDDGSSSWEKLNTINVFDTENSTISASGRTLLGKATNMAVAAIENKIYIFGDGNSKTIYIFDTETETFTGAKNAEMPSLYNDNTTTAVSGTKIYLFGGSSFVMQSSIYIFDTETETLISQCTFIPVVEGGTTVEIVGDKVYLFGGDIGYSNYCDKIIIASIKCPIMPSDKMAIKTSSNNLFYIIGNMVKTGIASVYVSDKVEAVGYGYAVTTDALLYDSDSSSWTSIYTEEGVEA